MLFCRAQYSHDSFFFEDKLKILKGAESIHLFVGSNSLFDKIYLATADALINPEALDLLKKANRVLYFTRVAQNVNILHLLQTSIICITLSHYSNTLKTLIGSLLRIVI